MIGYGKTLSLNSLVAEREGETVVVQCKRKIDGTNGKVVIRGTVHAESRNRRLDDGADNCGFARFVGKNAWPEGPLVINGEWAGEGINGGEGPRTFHVFAAHNPDTGESFVEPDVLKVMLKDSNVEVIPWTGGRITVTLVADGADPEEINVLVRQAAAAGFEGVVAFPLLVNDVPTTNADFARFRFKAVHDQYYEKKQPKPCTKATEVSASAEQFVADNVTAVRMEKARVRVDPSRTPKKFNEFVAHLRADIVTELGAELKASGLRVEQVSKQLVTAAKKFWFARL
jgi:hypothetical protein